MAADVVISGAGAACAVGTGCDALLDAICAGRDGLRPISRFDASPFAARLAGLWPEWDKTESNEASPLSPGTRPPPSAIEIGSVAAREAFSNARLAGTSPSRIAV